MLALLSAYIFLFALPSLIYSLHPQLHLSSLAHSIYMMPTAAISTKYNKDKPLQGGTVTFSYFRNADPKHKVFDLLDMTKICSDVEM